MKRLGFFTGKLYDSEINPKDIGECSTELNYKEPINQNEMVVRWKWKQKHEQCVDCMACKEAKNSLGI